MTKIIFDPSTVAKSAEVNQNFQDTWNGTNMDDESIQARHLAPDAKPTVRTYSVANPATLAINTDDYEMFVVTGLGQNITIGNPTGTPENGKGILIRIKASGGYNISYGTNYRAIGVTLPTNTVANKTMYLSARWNSTDSKWDLLSVGREA